MAVTQQLVRLSPALLDRCRTDVAALRELLAFALVERERYLDLDWPPAASWPSRNALARSRRPLSLSPATAGERSKRAFRPVRSGKRRMRLMLTRCGVSPTILRLSMCLACWRRYQTLRASGTARSTYPKTTAPPISAGISRRLGTFTGAPRRMATRS